MRKIIALALLMLTSGAVCAKEYAVVSPDGKLKISVRVGDVVEYAVSHEATQVLSFSPVSMTLATGELLGANPRVRKARTVAIDERIASPFYIRSEVINRCNELTLEFKGDYSIVFRAYDDGAAYRFVTAKKGEITIASEQVELNIPGDPKAYVAYVNTNADTFEQQFKNSFEQPYFYDNLTKLNPNKLKILPLLVELPGGKKFCFTEADLEEYPGLFLNNDTTRSVLRGINAPYPKTEVQGGHNKLQMLVTEREGFIARTQGTRSFPWRVFAVSVSDRQLAACDIVYRLASPSRIADVSWIKPGKVAWEWWNDWGLTGVDFKAGINNDTYKYYIDFASANGIEYVILDEGWSVRYECDLLQVVPEIDVKMLVDYAAERNVDIILWAGYHAFEKDMERVVRHYSEMGVKGFKIDFMDRDDQKMVAFTYRAAAVCAQYKMLVDLHGIYKPTGLLRTYPNVLNYEGVNGLEQLKWADREYDMVRYDVSIPFIRMVAGPMDYTQGAMRNAVKSSYHSVYSEPMSQGTRVHQLAEYVVFDSPINMMCDSPSNYMKESECTGFIAGVPTVWDETVPLDGRVGEYVALARRKGDVWYVGALTNWSSRSLTLDLSFLEEGTSYKAELFTDGANADKHGTDYKKTVAGVPSDRRLTVFMQPGGGFAARIWAE